MKRKYFPTDYELKIIRDLYDGTTEKTDKIMSMLGNKYPRWQVRRWANEMGLSKPKNPDWSEGEVEVLHGYYPKLSFSRLAERLRRVNGGIFRSPTAILLKAKRESINKRSDGFTMRMVEDLLGADHHKIEKWVGNGWLKDGYKGTRRIKSQGGDMHHFEANRLREFVINHPFEIDLRRVEPVSFIQLCAGML